MASLGAVPCQQPRVQGTMSSGVLICCPVCLCCGLWYIVDGILARL